MANQVLVPIDSSASITIANHAGTVDAFVDLAGVFTTSAGSGTQTVWADVNATRLVEVTLQANGVNAHVVVDLVGLLQTVST